VPQQRRHADHAARQRAYRARQADARATEQQAQGLPPAPSLPTIPSRARWLALLARARLAVDTVREEAQHYYDDRSEHWQDGDRAALLSEYLEALEPVLAALDDLPPALAARGGPGICAPASSACPQGVGLGRLG
jgi:hypothetical protein